MTRRNWREEEMVAETRRAFPEMKRFILHWRALAGAATLLFSSSALFPLHSRAGNDDKFGRLTFAIDVAQIGASVMPLKHLDSQQVPRGTGDSAKVPPRFLEIPDFRS